MKKIIAVVVVLVVLAAGLWFYESAEMPEGKPTEPVTIELANGTERVFDLEMARSAIEKEVGLMLREHLPQDGGMIFLFGRPARETGFWMKNTLIPLDMLFVGDDGKIVKVHANAQPQDLTPILSDFPVIAVIELNGGRAAALGITVGDRVETPLLK